MSTNGDNGNNCQNGNGHAKNSNSGADWTANPRWSGITRSYSYADVLRLRPEGAGPSRMPSDRQPAASETTGRGGESASFQRGS